MIPTAGDMTSLTDADFEALRQLMYRNSGVSLSDGKRALVCSRLSRRLRALRLTSFADYVEYLTLNDPESLERQELINCLTTNKTDFFREAHHFEFLRDHVIPELEHQSRRGGPRRLRIWSSACSQGDEPYSIAMTVLEHLPNCGAWDVQIVATDINTEVLAVAKNAQYPEEKFSSLSDKWLRKYLLQGVGENAGYYQVRPEVRRLVKFRQMNLMHPWPFQQTFDVIFCRNVIIYFDRPTQEELLRRMADQLGYPGYLMLGHSENSPWLGELFETRGNTIYRRRQNAARIRPQLPTPESRPRLHSLPGIRRLQPSGLTNTRAFSGEVALLSRHNIIAGQTYVLSEPGEISTVLGSCVAVCLYDPQTGIGGMNHFMLSSPSTDAKASARYGVHAMELLITGIMKQGGDRNRLKAKAFGGADVLKMKNELCQIGRQNVEFIRRFLATEQIPLVSEKLGGEAPLRIRFQPYTGRVLVETLSKASSVIQSETEYNAQVRQALNKPGDITLFN